MSYFVQDPNSLKTPERRFLPRVHRNSRAYQSGEYRHLSHQPSETLAGQANRSARSRLRNERL